MIPGESPPHSSPSPAVRVRDLSFHYPDGRQALREVNLALDPGECVALVGPNGAGKSTLLLHLNGLLPGKASFHSHGSSIGSHAHNGKSAGPSVWIEGIEVNAKNGAEVRRRVGLVFQDPDDQLFSTSVIDDVAFGPLNLGKPRAEARAIALASLDRVGLADAADRVPHHLSFGERKRACLAGVLACEPSILVLDEPTANLDPAGIEEVYAALAELVAAGDRAILHDGELLERYGLERP